MVFGTLVTDLVIDINGNFTAPTTAVVLSGIVNFDGTPQVLPVGATLTHPGTGQYVITFAAGTFSQGTPASSPVPNVTTLGTATTTSIQATTNPDGTFQLTGQLHGKYRVLLLCYSKLK